MRIEIARLLGWSENQVQVKTRLLGGGFGITQVVYRLEQAVRARHRHAASRPRRGLGFKALVAPTTSVAHITVGGDSSCILQVSTVDMGQGCDTAMAIVAADVLGIPAETIRVVHPDTDVTPYDMATLGSRSTFHMGNAVKLAAQDLLAKLGAPAAEVGPALRRHARRLDPAEEEIRHAGRHRPGHRQLHPAPPVARRRRTAAQRLVLRILAAVFAVRFAR